MHALQVAACNNEEGGWEGACAMYDKLRKGEQKFNFVGVAPPQEHTVLEVLNRQNM